MQRRLPARAAALGLSAALVLALGACGSSSSKASPATSPATDAGQPAGVTYPKAGPNPSASAKMICEPEAIRDIAAALLVKTTKVTAPTWSDHVYSCTYVYPKGSYTLSVKELSSWQETTDYFNSLAAKYGEREKLNGLGQGAFVAKNNDVVVRKDYKVLLVDVSKLPADFVPASSASDVATNVAAVIMGCWTGA